jgi:hypothetical protein
VLISSVFPVRHSYLRNKMPQVKVERIVFVSGAMSHVLKHKECKGGYSVAAMHAAVVGTCMLIGPARQAFVSG